MTELEKQLLSALEQLQQDYSQRLDEWESAFAEWRSMCGLMQREKSWPAIVNWPRMFSVALKTA
ncbi:hypothetical protein AUM42_21125 [Cronobacter malonaticus]|nr:hypothetical protein [Cronobacter malonaticus]